MRTRFYIDPDTGRPHVESHGVSAREAVEALMQAGQDYAGYGGARVALGQTAAGRYLKVIYKPEQSRASVFIITAYPVGGHELRAYRRRMRRRGKR